MGAGSLGSRKCSVCGSRFPHMPYGKDSCEWNPKFKRKPENLIEKQCPGCRGLKQISGVDCALCEGAGFVWVEVPV